MGFNKIDSVKGWMTTSGKTTYLKYLSGTHCTAKESILAKCAECCAGYHDGRMDCKMPDCPLYPFMPYGTKKQKFRRKVEKEDIAEE
jgi:hypothetical protein